jgi:hypothetical protein
VLQFKLQAQLFCHVSILHEHDRAAFILVVRSSKALMPSNARVKKPWACHTNAVTHPVLFQTNTAQAKQERKRKKERKVPCLPNPYAPSPSSTSKHASQSLPQSRHHDRVRSPFTSTRLLQRRPTHDPSSFVIVIRLLVVIRRTLQLPIKVHHAIRDPPTPPSSPSECSPHHPHRRW